MSPVEKGTIVKIDIVLVLFMFATNSTSVAMMIIVAKHVSIDTGECGRTVLYRDRCASEMGSGDREIPRLAVHLDAALAPSRAGRPDART